jgi:hypothetical protein
VSWGIEKLFVSPLTSKVDLTSGFSIFFMMESTVYLCYVSFEVGLNRLHDNQAIYMVYDSWFFVHYSITSCTPVSTLHITPEYTKPRCKQTEE